MTSDGSFPDTCNFVFLATGGIVQDGCKSVEDKVEYVIKRNDISLNRDDIHRSYIMDRKASTEDCLDASSRILFMLPSSTLLT
jgi:hypothetical protein